MNTHLRQGYGGQASDCPKEQVIVNAVLSGHWPQDCDDGLIAHARECATCREVANVSLLLREDNDYSRIEMHVPAAGQVWWRAAVRARLESTHAAARPITWMHSITGAIVLGVALAVITAIWPMVPEVVTMAKTLTREYLPNAEVANALAGGIRASLMIGAFAALLLVLTPLALYFVLSDD